MYWNHLLLVQLGWKHDAGAIWYLVASGHMENAWTYVEGGCIYYHTFIFDHTCESWGNGICCTAAVHCQYCRCLAKMIEWIASFETFLKRSTEKSEWTSSFPSCSFLRLFAFRSCPELWNGTSTIHPLSTTLCWTICWPILAKVSVTFVYDCICLYWQSDNLIPMIEGITPQNDPRVLRVLRVSRRSRVCLSWGLEAVMCITKEFDATRANVVCSGRKAWLEWKGDGRYWKMMKGHERCTHFGHVTACLAPGFFLIRLCILRITFLFSYWFFPKAFGPFHALLGESACYYAVWNSKVVQWTFVNSLTSLWKFQVSKCFEIFWALERGLACCWPCWVGGVCSVWNGKKMQKG